jgi:hypothetical protein
MGFATHHTAMYLKEVFLASPSVCAGSPSYSSVSYKGRLSGEFLSVQLTIVNNHFYSVYERSRITINQTASALLAAPFSVMFCPRL